MRRRRGPWLLPLLLCAGCGPLPPWPSPPDLPLDLRAELSATAVPLLQPFELRLDLFRGKDTEAKLDPAIPDGTSGSVELLPEREYGPGRWQRAVLHLRAVRGPGPLVIAPFRVDAGDGKTSASTDELHIDVTSLLADAGQALELPGPLLLPPPPRWPWFAGGGAIVLLALLVWWLRRRARRPRPTPLQIELPPHTRALRELLRLRGTPRRTTAEVEAFYVGTSSVLRVYFEERFGLHAPERTTEEFLQEIEVGGPLSTAQCLDVRRFLQQCDLVKFAAAVPDEVAHLQTLAIAEQLVEATRADRPAAAERQPPPDDGRRGPPPLPRDAVEASA